MYYKKFSTATIKLKYLAEFGVRFEGKPLSLLTMTDTKSVKVLKKEEVEKRNHGTVVELPFVPIVNEEAESTTQDVTVKLPNDTKVTITKIAHSANKESFLVQSIVVKNHVAKDLGLYAEAEGHEKEMEKCQIDIDRYCQDPEAEQQDQRSQQKYDKALEDYTKLEKLRDEVVKKMLDLSCTSSTRLFVASSTISYHPRLIPLRGLTCEV